MVAFGAAGVAETILVVTECFLEWANRRKPGHRKDFAGPTSPNCVCLRDIFWPIPLFEAPTERSLPRVRLWLRSVSGSQRPYVLIARDLLESDKAKEANEDS